MFTEGIFLVPLRGPIEGGSIGGMSPNSPSQPLDPPPRHHHNRPKPPPRREQSLQQAVEVLIPWEVPLLRGPARVQLAHAAAVGASETAGWAAMSLANTERESRGKKRRALEKGVKRQRQRFMCVAQDRLLY